MKLLYYPSVLLGLFTTLTPYLVTASPLSSASRLFARNKSWEDLHPCLYSNFSGHCTAYIVTSDKDVDDYRNIVLYTSRCEFIQALRVSKFETTVLMRGSLPDTVILNVNEYSPPTGFIHYNGRDTRLESMECVHPVDADGSGCRVEFDC